MILYIHGFGSSGRGFKVNEMKQWFGDENILAPSLSYIPELAMDTLIQLVELLQKNQQSIRLIGSSLGGYYALYLAERYQLKAVLINPAIYPYRELKVALGYSLNYYDQSTFLCTEEHLSALKKFEIDEPQGQENLLLLLQKHDEVLNYRDAIEKLPRAKTFVDTNGDHGYGNIVSKRTQIFNFIDS